MGFVLRLRWLWLAKVDSDKTWSGYFFRADRSSHDFFDAFVQYRWVMGQVPCFGWTVSSMGALSSC
jgi:hypothetical protein